MATTSNERKLGNGNNVWLSTEWTTGLDTLFGEGGHDTIFGDGRNNFLYGDKGNDNLYGGDGEDTLEGGDQFDFLSGGSGTDHLYGGRGHDYLNGGWQDASTDHLWGGSGHDYLYSGDGNDFLYGENGNDFMAGWNGDDFLDGGADYDTLFGGSGDDVLIGGAGDDRLEGGAGADRLTGGAGADTFVFGEEGIVNTPVATRDRGPETDTVTDFSQDEGDRLDFRGLAENKGFEHLIFKETDDFSGTGLLADGSTNSNFKPEVQYLHRSEDQTGPDGESTTRKWTLVRVDVDGLRDESGKGNAEIEIILEGDHYTLTDTDMLGVVAVEEPPLVA